MNEIDSKTEPAIGRRTILAAAGAALVVNSTRVTGEPLLKGNSDMADRANQDCFVYVGCRTTRERNARGDGINVYRMNAETGDWTHVQLLDGLLNPSFFAMDARGRFLYTVHGDGSEVSSFRIEPASGKVMFLNKQSTHGKNPVHLAFAATGRYLIVANHVSSSLAVLPVKEDGSIGELTDLMTLSGKIGPHRVEQPFPKPHQIVFDPQKRFMIVPDKGLDCIVTYRLDPAAGKLVTADAAGVVARETSGPRHAVFHPAAPFAYVINELDSTLTTYGYDRETGSLTPLQIVSALPDTFTGNSRGSEIEISPDGRFIYASNRGFDSVAVFSVDSTSGHLAPVEWVESKGQTPRFFAGAPGKRFLFVANEDSDTIVRFERDADSGKLHSTDGIVKTGSPVCILFRPVNLA